MDLRSIMMVKAAGNAVLVEKKLAHKIGINHATFLAQLIAMDKYHNKEYKLGEKWIYCKEKDMEDKTGLSSKQQFNVIDDLVEEGFIEYDKKPLDHKNGLNVRHFKLKPAVFGQIIAGAEDIDGECGIYSHEKYMELYDNSSKIQVNRRVAKDFGIRNAIFYSELVDIHDRLVKNGSIEFGDWFVAKQDEMSNRTAIPNDSQKARRDELEKFGLIESDLKGPYRSTRIKLNLKFINKYFEDAINDYKKKMGLFTQDEPSHSNSSGKRQNKSRQKAKLVPAKGKTSPGKRQKQSRQKAKLVPAKGKNLYNDTKDNTNYDTKNDTECMNDTSKQPKDFSDKEPNKNQSSKKSTSMISKLTKVFYKSFSHTMNGVVIDELNKYIEFGMEFDLIAEALKLAAKKGYKFQYSLGILADWKKQGFKTLAARNKVELNGGRKNNSNSNPNNSSCGVNDKNNTDSDPKNKNQFETYGLENEDGSNEIKEVQHGSGVVYIEGNDKYKDDWFCGKYDELMVDINNLGYAVDMSVSPEIWKGMLEKQLGKIYGC